MSYWGIAGGVVGGIAGATVAILSGGAGAGAIPAGISIGMALGGSVGGAVDSNNQKNETEKLQAEAAARTMDMQKMAANKQARATYNQAQRQNTGGQIFNVASLEAGKSTGWDVDRDKADPFQPKEKKHMLGNPQIMKAVS